MDLINIYTDGGARGNPGPAASAIVICDDQDKVIYKNSKYLGIATNNFAEYSAVILALERITGDPALGIAKGVRIAFHLDSELIVSQLNGLYKIKSPNLIPLAVKIRNLLKTLNSKFKITFNHIPRSRNKLADKLVNECLDHNNKTYSHQ
jgi:ribonuclease HI